MNDSKQPPSLLDRYMSLVTADEVAHHVYQIDLDALRAHIAKQRVWMIDAPEMSDPLFAEGFHYELDFLEALLALRERFGGEAESQAHYRRYEEAVTRVRATQQATAKTDGAQA